MLLRAAAEVAAGYVYGQIFENLAHKYILHEQGKDKESYWSFHFHEHHKAAVKYGLLDPDYLGPWWSNRPTLREAGALAGAVLLHAPLAPFFPYFFATLCVRAGNYYYKHKKCHTDPEWGLEHMVNHVKHHLIDQNAYWGVTSGWLDSLVGTAPEVGPEEWDEMKDFYLQRYRAVRQKVEKEATVRSAQAKNDLEGLVTRLYDSVVSRLT